MIIVTTPYLSDHRVVETKGHVFGLVVRSRGLAGNVSAFLRSLGGGEIHEYAKLIGESREQSIDRMVAEAESLGANAIVAVRFTTSVMMGGAAELLAFGTAVVVEDA